MSNLQFDPDYCVPPGITLYETIIELGISRTELATELGLSGTDVDSLILGDLVLTPGIADALQRVTKIPASFWKNREAAFRKHFNAV